MSTSAPPPRRALTVTDLMRELQGWIDRDATYAGYPVAILDMHGDEVDYDEPWDGLVTDVEPDMFTVEHGNVMLLSSDPMPTARQTANLARDDQRMSTDYTETYAAFRCARCRAMSEGNQYYLGLQSTVVDPASALTTFGPVTLCESCARAAKQWISEKPRTEGPFPPIVPIDPSELTPNERRLVDAMGPLDD